ncbi:MULTISPECIES: glutathione S-transferase [Citromicrobium]|uniref:glutathione S-transferase n=1 Tax=Citromicrobium TaxID=72173 RepID=UPI0001DD058C|nr:MULTISPECIES: glutathione S-transferase [Citromicrobium]ALG60463.1 hypothetical protein WG74_06120 [Citromicrobium sp. JL477]
MLFYDSAYSAPNPRRIRIFTADNGIDLPTRDIAIKQVWVHTHDFTATLPGRNAEWGEANRPRVASGFRYFDGAQEGRECLRHRQLLCRRHHAADEDGFRQSVRPSARA